MTSRVIVADCMDDLANIIDQLAEIGFSPTLGILFMPASFKAVEVQRMFILRRIDLFAVTSDVQIAGGRTSNKSIVVMLLDVERSAYRIAAIKVKGSANCAGRVSSNWLNSKFRKSSNIVFGAKNMIGSMDYLNGYRSGKAGMRELFGAFASGTSYVFTRKFSSSRGIIILTFDSSRVQLQGLLLSNIMNTGPDKIAKGMENAEETEQTIEAIHNNLDGLASYQKSQGRYDVDALLVLLSKIDLTPSDPHNTHLLKDVFETWDIPGAGCCLFGEICILNGESLCTNSIMSLLFIRELK